MIPTNYSGIVGDAEDDEDVESHDSFSAAVSEDHSIAQATPSRYL